MKVGDFNFDYTPESDILMLFAEQPEENPQHYFIEGITLDHLRLGEIPFKSAYCFHNAEEFYNVWNRMADDDDDLTPDSMWYWVFYAGQCICSGAFDCGDNEIFETCGLFDPTGDNTPRHEEPEFIRSLYDNLNRENRCFKRSFFRKNPMEVYAEYYQISFFEAYYELLTSVDDYLYHGRMWRWLSEKKNPIHFLYDRFMDNDRSLSHDWNEMLDFIAETFKEETAAG